MVERRRFVGRNHVWHKWRADGGRGGPASVKGDSMRIAVIGTGIAGMTAAYRLSREHEVTVYEAAGYVGGHTNTVEVDDGGTPLRVDTGFIVYNEKTYPGFCALMDELGVATQLSEMSFSVRDDTEQLEYCGSTLNSLFAQRGNLLSPNFIRMVIDILDFNRASLAFLEEDDDALTLGEYLSRGAWRREFIEQYVIPMGAAIWSMQPAAMFEFPAIYFLRFFANHGLLQIRDRPRWRTVTGGSARYVEKLTAPYRDRIRLATPVSRVQRREGSAQVMTGDDGRHYDAVFMAVHSDQALRILERPTAAEKSILGAIPYQRNDAVLHTDVSLLPRRKRAWASWNYHLPAQSRARATLTYNMNILQRLEAEQTYCVTLNQSEEIDPAKVLATFNYDHPVYSRESVRAQRRHAEINGLDRIYYCGAYWGHGFHEDGLQSAHGACLQFEQDLDDGKLHLRRVG